MLVAIIGGGPAGMSAALQLARARHRVLLFDSNKPRNRVTNKMHGFLTREAITPTEFRRIANHELSSFRNVKRYQTSIVKASKLSDGTFVLVSNKGTKFQVERIVLAMGLQETLPNVPHVTQFYGKSLYSCPYCDGYELRNQPLAIITEVSNGLSLTASIMQWSKSLYLFTNGKGVLTDYELELLQAMNVEVITEPITKLVGKQGKLTTIITANNRRISCNGGFISTYWKHSGDLAQQLECKINSQGGIWQDGKGRTSINGVYVAGDVTNISPAQGMLAAGDGVKAAISLNQDIAQLRLQTYAANIPSSKSHT